MLIQSPSLGDQLAHLRIPSRGQETCGWLPAAVHAMIMALLARIFGRLEQILLLWQSGTLPPAHSPASSRAVAGGLAIGGHCSSDAPLDRPDATRSAPRGAGHVPRVAVRQRCAAKSRARRLPAVFSVPSTVMLSARSCAALRARAARDPPGLCRPIRRKPLAGGQEKCV